LREYPQFETKPAASAITALAAARRLPTLGSLQLVKNGGLVGYGVDFNAMWRLAAYFVDKIFKGANPGDLPIEQATHFHTIVNLKTAKTIGVDIPPAAAGRRERGDRMRRREFIAWLGAAATPGAWPLSAPAQPTKIPRVGYVWFGRPDPNVGLAGLRQGLADRGYVLGRNLLLEERYAEGDRARVPGLIAELLALDVDVLVTGTSGTILAARKATTMVPIVGVAADWVGSGLADSLSRPGANVTGLSLLSVEISSKWLEYLKEAVPKLNRVAVLGNDNPATLAEMRRIDEAAAGFGIAVTRLNTAPQKLDASLTAMTGANFDGLIATDTIEVETLLPRLIPLVARNRLPTIYGFSFAARLGGLMAYSANFFEIWRRLAGYVDRILKGARPADLPIEQATEFKFAINLKTAKALGLDIPPMLLAAANEVIE
jgi:putative ABC transport system substrate-binding protein